MSEYVNLKFAKTLMLFTSPSIISKDQRQFICQEVVLPTLDPLSRIVYLLTDFLYFGETT